MAWNRVLLLGLDVEFLHQSSILGKILAHEARELVGRAANGLLSRAGECLPDRRIGQRLGHLEVETLGDDWRSSDRSKYAEPLIKDQPFDSRVLEGRHIGQARRARLRGLCQQTQVAGFVVGYERRRSEGPEFHVAGNKIVDRLRSAPVRHLLEREASD